MTVPPPHRGATFAIEVAPFGRFTFRRRQIRDQIRIEADAERLLGGPVEDIGLSNAAFALATLQVLTVAAPPGWDLGAVDPLDRAALEDVYRVFGRLRAQEDSFCDGVAAARAGLGTGSGGQL